jgi:Spy/CpxP family protein refolding chaperone
LAAVLAAGIVTVVAAQPGGRFGGFGGTDVETLVFTNTPLQEDLKLTGEQKEKLKPISTKYADLNKKRADIFKDGFDMEKMTELRDETKKVSEEAKKVRDEVLTDAQKKRMKQIEIQVMGLTVFNDPEAKGGGGGGKGGKGGKGGGGGGGGFGFGVSDSQKALMKDVQDTLKLTDSQKSTIKTIVADFNKERGEIFKDAGIGGGGGGGGGKGGKGGGGGTFDLEKMEAASKKIDKVQKEAMAKVEESFDDTQKKAWKDLVGDAFDTSKLRPVAAKKD